MIDLDLAGEHALDQARDGDDVPLQALGAVHGQHLDPLGLDDHLAGFQPVLLVLGRLQEGEERAQAAVVGLGGEVGGDVEEPVEVHPADPCPVGDRLDLDVDAGDSLDVGDQFGQRGEQAAAQPPQLAGQPRHAPVPVWRVPLGGPQVVERLDQAASIWCR